MAINVGDAVLTFFGNTEQLDQVFARLPAQTEAAMGAAAASVGGLGQAVGGVNFELDATAQNVPYAGEVIKDAMGKAEHATHEARGEVALIKDAIGIDLPRHVMSFIASIPGVSTALSAAFSATAILFVIEALAQVIEKIQKFQEHAHEVELAWNGFNTSLLTSATSINDKVLEAGVSVDKLRGNHLAALRKELELIDHTSLRDLMTEFDVLAKASDAMFAQIKRSWLEFDAGSTGAKSALTDFKSQYDLLLAEGKTKEASDLLAGTLKSARDTLTTMEKQNDEAAKQAQAMRETNSQAGAAAAFYQVIQTHKEGELKAQETIIRALQAQVDAEKKISEYTNERKQVKEIQEDNREINEKERILQANAKAEQQAVTEEERLRTEARNKAITGLQEEEKEKIAATRQGSEARLATIEAAIREEESKGLQDTAFYRSLQEQKVRFHADALAAREKSENLAAAQALSTAENAAKLETATTTEAYSQQERAVTALGSFKLVSATDVSKRLELLYTQENNKLLAILNDLLKKEEAAVKATQAKLSKAQSNPLVSPQEIDELKQLLTKEEKAVAETQVKISTTTKQFQDKQLSLDRGYYGQALALAIASGQRESAAKLRSIHDALLVAQAEATEAKARHLNTDAIDKEIKELQKQEREQEKLIRGNNKEKESMNHLREATEMAYRGMAEAFFTATESMVRGQVSFGKAMEALTLEMLASIAKHYANIYIAKGIGNLADMNWSQAALDFAAAAAFEVVGGALSGMAANISSGEGSSKGSSGSGRANVDTSKTENKPVATGSTTNVPRLFSGAIVTQPTMAMIGDSASGGRQTEGVFPLNDPRAAQAIRRLFGGESEGGIVNNFNIRGMLSTQDLAKTARVITRGAQTGRLRVSVSQSGRVIKKG